MEQNYDPLSDGFLAGFEQQLFEQSVDGDSELQIFMNSYFADTSFGGEDEAEGALALQVPHVHSAPTEDPAGTNSASAPSATPDTTMPPQAVPSSSENPTQTDNGDTASSSCVPTPSTSLAPPDSDTTTTQPQAVPSALANTTPTDCVDAASSPSTPILSVSSAPHDSDTSSIPLQAVLPASPNDTQTDNANTEAASSRGASHLPPPATASGSRTAAKRRQSDQADRVDADLKRVKQTPDENIDPQLREWDLPVYGPHIAGSCDPNAQHPAAFPDPIEPYLCAGAQAGPAMPAEYDAVGALGMAACGAPQPVMGAYDTPAHAFGLSRPDAFQVPSESHPNVGAPSVMPTFFGGVDAFDAAAYAAPPPIMGAYDTPAHVLAPYNGHLQGTVPYTLSNVAPVNYGYPPFIPFIPPVDTSGLPMIDAGTLCAPPTVQPPAVPELPQSSIIFKKKTKKVTNQALRHDGTAEQTHKTPNNSGHEDPAVSDAARQRTTDAHRANDARTDHADAIICLWTAAAAAAGDSEPCHRSFAGTAALLSHCVQDHGVRSAKTGSAVTSCLWADCPTKAIREGSLKRHVEETHGRRSRFKGRKGVPQPLVVFAIDTAQVDVA